MSTESEILHAYDGSDDDQYGGELAYFVGKQYGSGWLRMLGRFAFPILKRVVRVAGNVARDALNKPEKPIPTSLRDNALNEVARTAGDVIGTSINRGRKRKADSSKPSLFNSKQRRKRA